ncbi:MAG: class I SAM-dependent methyltransferase [Lentisphaerae bacterium]|nr:class I SAM-dependent methyltransferase [Lentisphaerota bacterium]
MKRDPVKLTRSQYQDQVRRAIAFLPADQAFCLDIKARHFLRFCTAAGRLPSAMDVLDFGCGHGLMHPFLAPQVGRLTGLDVSPEALASARAANPACRYVLAGDSGLPFPDAAFDGALAVCVLHHVQPADRNAVLRDLCRVLKPGAPLVIFEHNPLHPLTRWAVSRCPFDKDARLLLPRTLAGALRQAGFDTVQVRHILFLPLGRRLTLLIDRLLGRLPAGAQYAAIGFACSGPQTR